MQITVRIKPKGETMPEVKRSTDYTPDHKANYWLAAEIAKNIEDEGEAIAHYEELLGRLDPEVDEKTIAAIQEIVAQEKEHVEKLSEILKCYDKVKPAKGTVSRTIKG